MHKRFLVGLLAALLMGFSTTALTVQAAACDGTSEVDFVNRGDFKVNNEDWSGAVDEYTCALELNPDNPDALFWRGYAYYELREFTEAEADYDLLLEQTPDNSAANNNLANIYYARGDYQTALDYYNRSIELDAGDPISFYNRANLHFEMGNFDAALKDANETLRLRPSYADGFLARGRIYQGLGDPRANDDFNAWVDATRTATHEVAVGEGLKDEHITMSEGLVFEVPLTLAVGQVIQAAARTNRDSNVDTLMVLLDADGNPVASDDDSGVNLDAVLEYTVQTEGTYTLLVTHSNGGSDGPVLLTVTVGGEAAVGAEAETFTDYGLFVDTPAVVYTTEGDHLNLRSGPGLDFEVIAKLNRDTLVTLLEGPKKADGYAWWRVQTADGATGWAVERVDEEQTLQLGLIIGEGAVVTSTEGDMLRVREGAGRSFSIVVQLEPGTLVTVLEGPQIVDDLSWWKIRTADGVEGWAVERVADDRTLARHTDAGVGLIFIHKSSRDAAIASPVA